MLILSTPKMEAANSSETHVLTRFRRQNILEDGILREWSGSCSGRNAPWDDLQYQLYRRPGGFQSQSGNYEGKKHPMPLQEN
jgi:hypothetical protein